VSARPERPYADPYLAGVGLGLVLLASYVVMGRGLGASGAFNSAAAGVLQATGAAPRTADSPWTDWLVFEVLGVFAGGLASAWLAGRVRVATERGPHIGVAARLCFAFAGGAVMGIGAVLARGCTSGQALTGGALLSVGSWIFIACAFGAAYAVAPLVRRLWR
jgi:hypothetical protein